MLAWELAGFLFTVGIKAAVAPPPHLRGQPLPLVHLVVVALVLVALGLVDLVEDMAAEAPAVDMAHKTTVF